MPVIGLIERALTESVAKQHEAAARWRDVTMRFGGIAGWPSLNALASLSQNDLLLRQMEVEYVDLLAADMDREMVLHSTYFLGLSEAWVSSGYELLRTACASPKLTPQHAATFNALHERFALVRMPIAKALIAGGSKKVNKRALASDPLVLSFDDGTGARPYEEDATYNVPRQISYNTGSVEWRPIELKTRSMVMISRESLSDEFLALFD